MLTHANHIDSVNCALPHLPHHTGLAHRSEVQDSRKPAGTILDQGDAINPPALGAGPCGAVKQSKPANLIGRQRDYADDYWRFMTVHDIPFADNIAEQVMRILKVKQQASGCFRT